MKHTSHDYHGVPTVVTAVEILKLETFEII
jgi:hypothetical protein